MILTAAVLQLSGCKVQLQGPSGPPEFQPQGLYIQTDDDVTRILSIACGPVRHSARPQETKCFFLHQVRVFRDLAFSGKRIEITERWGTMETDPDEALLTRTVFVRYHVEVKEGEEWKVDALSGPKVDRELTGDDTFLHLHFREGCLQDDEGCWKRLPGNLIYYSPETRASLEDWETVFHKFEGQSVAFSPSLDYFLRNGMIVEGQKFKLKGQCNTEASVMASGGGYSALKSGTSPSRCGAVFTVEPETKDKWNLAELYSLRTGTGTPMSAEKAQELSEKEKRRQEIRERIKRGEKVSQEELLEVLED
ncbi:MAG: hypothetical protein KDK25_04400 [Leptospiraceae bacterium]|nr:hypothetical protein [Leptospiraceae bacterium]